MKLTLSYLLLALVAWGVDGVGAVVGAAYVGIVWDSRPGKVLCQQHDRTWRFAQQIGTKNRPFVNCSTGHFVCKPRSYPTCRWVEASKVEVEQSSCNQVQRGQNGATYHVDPSGCGREVWGDDTRHVAASSGRIKALEGQRSESRSKLQTSNTLNLSGTSVQVRG